MKKLTKSQKQARSNKKKIDKLYKQTKKKIVGKKQTEINKIWAEYREKKFLIKHPIQTKILENENRILLPIFTTDQKFNFKKVIDKCYKKSKEKGYVSLTVFCEVEKESFEAVQMDDDFEANNKFYVGISQTYLQVPINKPNFLDFIDYFFTSYIK